MPADVWSSQFHMDDPQVLRFVAVLDSGALLYQYDFSFAIGAPPR